MAHNSLVIGAYSLAAGTYVALGLLFVLLSPRQRTHQLLAIGAVMLALNFALLQLAIYAHDTQAPALQILNIERFVAYTYLIEGFFRLAGTINHLKLYQLRVYRRIQQATGAAVCLSLILLLPIFDRLGANYVPQPYNSDSPYPIYFLKYVLTDHPFITLAAVIGLGTILVVNILHSYLFIRYKMPKRAMAGSLMYLVALLATVIPAFAWIIPWVMMAGGVLVAQAILQGTLFDPLRSANAELALSFERTKALARQLEQTVAAAGQEVIDRTSELTFALQREKLLAAELESSLQLESELNELKSRIITNVSHEFRSPLTIIRTSSELLSEHRDRLSQEKQTKHRQQVYSQIAYLDDMIKGVLFINDTNVQGLEPDWYQYSFAEINQHLTEAWTATCSKQAELKLATFGDQDTEIATDVAFLIAIGNYLLSNAIRFNNRTPQIHIALHLEGEQLQIAFRDNGIGIPAGEEEKIFTLFFRGSNIEQQRGMGLGLYSARKISEALSGELVLAASSPAGSSFVLTFPVNAQRKRATQAEMASA